MPRKWDEALISIRTKEKEHAVGVVAEKAREKGKKEKEGGRKMHSLAPGDDVDSSAIRSQIRLIFLSSPPCFQRRKSLPKGLSTYERREKVRRDLTKCCGESYG